tara:strand:- start:674 stop:820 length:147 start_codon:yes stop_codon:yes gene_type:complete
MPNKAAKQRKQQKARVNKQLQKQGRTAKQYKKWLDKQPKNQTPAYGKR